MEEQPNSQSQNLDPAVLEQHPDLVRDPEKAHYMAIASDESERLAARNRQIAQGYAGRIGTEGTFEEAMDRGEGPIWDGVTSAANDEERLLRAKQRMSKASEFSAEAKKQAEEAASRYDLAQEILGKKAA